MSLGHFHNPKAIGTLINILRMTNNYGVQEFVKGSISNGRTKSRFVYFGQVPPKSAKFEKELLDQIVKAQNDYLTFVVFYNEKPIKLVVDPDYNEIEKLCNYYLPLGIC